MIVVHQDLAEAVRAFFEGIRSLGVANQLGSFVVGWGWGWFLLWARRKLKIG